MKRKLSVFILIDETMYTLEDLIASLTEENRIITHLFGKIPFEKEGILDYRPNEDQRTLFELLEYMMMMGNSISSVLVAGTYNPETLAPFKEEVSSVDVQKDFVVMMEKQLASVISRLEWLTEEQMEELIDPFGGGDQKRKIYFLEVLLKSYTGYRMQLFLYLKDSGERHLNTANVWQGKDAG